MDTTFANPVRLQRAIHSDPQRARLALEGVLTQEQADAFEAALAPSNNEKRQALHDAREALEKAGLDERSAAVIEVTTAIDAVPVDDVE